MSENKETLEKEEPVSDLYQPAQRHIYSYFDGQKVIAVDPMTVYRRVLEHGPELSIDFKVANSPSKDACKAYTSLLKHLREVFQLPPFEQGGLMETEVLELLDHFLRYCKSVKKNWNPLPIYATATSASSVSSAAGNPATPNSSDSGSTRDAPCTAAPAPLPSEPQQPSGQSTPA